MEKNLSIEKIRETVRLLKKANCTPWATVTETAQELKVPKTALMAFIEKHPGHFILAEPKTDKDWKGKNPGLLICEAFRSPDENWTTDDWLRAQKERWKDTIHVEAFIEYTLQGYYIQEDVCICGLKEDNRQNRHLWRNTPEKMRRIAASGHTRPGSFWGGGDGRMEIKKEHTVNAADLRALRAEGWTIDGGPDFD